MGQKNEDRFLDEIDAELRSVKKKLRKTFSDVQVLLGEFSGQGDEDHRTDGCPEGHESVAHDDESGRVKGLGDNFDPDGSAEKHDDENQCKGDK